jgi:hypothetical protein
MLLEKFLPFYQMCSMHFFISYKGRRHRREILDSPKIIELEGDLEISSKSINLPKVMLLSSRVLKLRFAEVQSTF